jgi:enterochelin esterase-like enzyme
MEKSEEIKSTIEELTIYSDYLDEEINVIVYLPPAYSNLYTYPVLYVQDGQDYFQLGRIATFADEGIAKKQLDDFIIVGIPYKSVADRRTKYHPKGEKSTAYQQFLVYELVPFIDKKYSTHHLGYGRSLIGDSLAGTASFLTSINFPHTFANVVMQSPFVNEQLLEAANNFKANASSLNIYHVIGEEETEVETTKGKIRDFLTPNRQLHDILMNKPVSYFYEEFKGDHTWTHWQPDLKRALSFLYEKK